MFFEGFVTTIYKDVANYDTIGYGHLVTNDKWRSYDSNNDGILQKPEAIELLKSDIKGHEIWKKHLTRNITTFQETAITSLAFNLGVNSKAIKDIVKHINANELTLASKVFLKYTKAKVDGKYVELKGLVRRRQFEYNLFILGI